jgi:hypothetical protein
MNDVWLVGYVAMKIVLASNFPYSQSQCDILRSLLGGPNDILSGGIHLVCEKHSTRPDAPVGFGDKPPKD